jgi:hypothetical protein
VPGADVNALSDVFSRALAIEPGARFASASDLVDALRPILARTQTVASAVAVPSGSDSPSLVADAPTAPPDFERRDTRTDSEPLPSFLSPTDTHDYGRVEEHEDDISAELPLIASAGAAPMFEIAADDRPGFFPPRDRSSQQDDHVGPYLDIATPPPARPIEPPAEATPSLSHTLNEPTLSGPMWASAPPTVRERRPFLALIIALVVGIAGGFGWGYWTAWRAAERETTASATPLSTGPEASRPSEARPTPAPPQHVEEPAVVGEAKLPPPSQTTPRAAPPKAATSETPTAARRPAGQNNSRRTAAAATTAQASRTERGQTEQSRTPVATTGSLLVDSRPVGAEVSIDGRSVGVTPVSINDLAPGEHRVVLQIPGFNLWATTAQVKAGSRTRVAASLEQVQLR